MGWDGFKKMFGGKRTDSGGAGAARPKLRWIAADQNPFGVDIVDIAPVTQYVVATSTDPSCAANAISFGTDDGSAFAGVAPPAGTTVALDLRYPIDRMLADGPLFLPTTMDHKWAIFFRDSTIIFVRSWRRQVVATAEVRVSNGEVLISRLTGQLASGTGLLDERIVDFLIRTHVLQEPFPAPVEADDVADLDQLALKCFSLFGNIATCATPHKIAFRPPLRPLRSHSLLHIAVARGDLAAAERHLAAGVPIDLLAADGLAPLHWSIARVDSSAMTWLLDRGAPVDTRSTEGATPLMNAVQARNASYVELLLARGADPNAQDLRGFNALHRAAEMGETAIVRALVARGADPNAQAQGHTAISFARRQGHDEIVRILGERSTV